jgi:UDP-GlcNAc:undecaprenyl-phosphate GlcNAc-1-phosphate transferase
MHLKAIDLPNGRKVHNKSIPMIGGLGIFISSYLTILIPFFIFLNNKFSFEDLGIEFFALFFGGLILMLYGMFDDIKETKAKEKFIIESIIATLLYFLGLKIQSLYNPFGADINLGLFSLPFTVLWIVGITNAINITDGIDGLASGMSFIACVMLSFVSMIFGNYTIFLISLSLAGAILGFLKYNIYPASIFLGDTGSLFLGYMISAISILACQNNANHGVYLLIPIIILAVPIMDTITSIIRRLIKGRFIFQADKEHFHHKLLTKGYTHRQAAFILCGNSLLFGIGALLLTTANHTEAFILLFLNLLGTYLILRKFAHHEIRHLAKRIKNGANGNKPSFKPFNLSLDEFKERLENSKDLFNFKEKITKLLEELEYDQMQLILKLTNKIKETKNIKLEWGSKNFYDDGRINPDDIWQVTVQLNGLNGGNGKLVLGKYIYKMTRNRLEEKWAKKIGESISDWLSNNYLKLILSIEQKN